ncbi:MAG: hypothetical protein J0L61_04220 [Planctomycetes bacterium]|nr:hypothetical protein [Planctomycetota bacterium]
MRSRGLWCSGCRAASTRSSEIRWRVARVAAVVIAASSVCTPLQAAAEDLGVVLEQYESASREAGLRPSAEGASRDAFYRAWLDKISLAVVTEPAGQRRHAALFAAFSLASALRSEAEVRVIHQQLLDSSGQDWFERMRVQGYLAGHLASLGTSASAAGGAAEPRAIIEAYESALREAPDAGLLGPNADAVARRPGATGWIINLRSGLARQLEASGKHADAAQQYAIAASFGLDLPGSADLASGEVRATESENLLQRAAASSAKAGDVKDVLAHFARIDALLQERREHPTTWHAVVVCRGVPASLRLARELAARYATRAADEASLRLMLAALSESNVAGSEAEAVGWASEIVARFVPAEDQPVDPRADRPDLLDIAVLDARSALLRPGATQLLSRCDSFAERRWGGLDRLVNAAHSQSPNRSEQ